MKVLSFALSWWTTTVRPSISDHTKTLWGVYCTASEQVLCTFVCKFSCQCKKILWIVFFVPYITVFFCIVYTYINILKKTLYFNFSNKDKIDKFCIWMDFLIIFFLLYEQGFHWNMPFNSILFKHKELTTRRLSLNVKLNNHEAPKCLWKSKRTLILTITILNKI